MKITVLVLLFSAISLAQTLVPQGNGYTYTFDIKYGGAATQDSVEWLDLNLDYGDLVQFWVEGNANSSVDSIYVRSGAKDISSYGTAPADTVWGNYATLGDSVYGSISSPIVNSARGKHFFLKQPVIDMLEFGLLNYRGALPTRSVTIVMKIKKSTAGQ